MHPPCVLEASFATLLFSPGLDGRDSCWFPLLLPRLRLLPTLPFLDAEVESLFSLRTRSEVIMAIDPSTLDPSNDALWASPVPDGETRMVENAPSSASGLNEVGIATTVVALICVIARLFTRIWVVRGVGADDCEYLGQDAGVNRTGASNRSRFDRYIYGSVPCIPGHDSGL